MLALGWPLSARYVLFQCTHCANRANHCEAGKLAEKLEICARCHPFRSVADPIERWTQQPWLPSGKCKSCRTEGRMCRHATKPASEPHGDCVELGPLAPCISGCSEGAVAQSLLFLLGKLHECGQSKAARARRASPCPESARYGRRLAMDFDEEVLGLSAGLERSNLAESIGRYDNT